MAQKFKDFGAGDGTVGDDIAFALYGKTFKCLPQMQGATIIDFTVISSGDDVAAQAAMVDQFFKATIVPEDYDAFNAICHAPETIVTVAILASIIGWIMEQYTSRPPEGLINS